MQIDFQKIDLPFEPDLSTAVPLVETRGTDVLLSFLIHGMDDMAKIEFVDCLMYRVGAPNDEGFYLFGVESRINNDSIYSKNAFPNLDFDTFYKVIGVDWKNDLLGNGTKILDNQYKEKEGFIHFVFFMKDGTFECVAKNYEIE